MALLENGRVIADRWTTVADDAPLPSDGPVIVGAARLREEVANLAGREIGVRLTSAETAESVVDLLPLVGLVAVEFPKFRDGRGFTTGRSLRQHHGFSGEIRAVGNTLPDQYRFLLRCGFSTVEIPDDRDPAPWQKALEEISVAYQPVVDQAPAASLLRRRLFGGEVAQ